MAIDRTQPNQNWQVANEQGVVASWEEAQVAVLMDIRRELQQLNALLGCANCVGIPGTLRTIARNTAKPKKPRKR